MKILYKRIVTILASRATFWAIWLFSIFQAVWIAVTARYPMAFDEAYHLNIIKLHTLQWGPLFLKQPPGPATYGALTRDPSYLHHYLLSFPYRILHAVGASEYTTVVTLRLLNVAMFATGLYLFWKLLQKTKASLAAINSAVLFFILIPTVPLLAGQINYDNLQFPMFATAMLLTIRAMEGFRKKRIDTTAIIAGFSVSLLGSLNKFTFLPVLTAITVYLIVLLARQYMADKKRFCRLIKKDWQALTGLRQKLLIGLAAISSGLFIWTYGVNIVVYHNPTAQCGQVLGADRCQTYGPWARNYRLAQEKTATAFKPNPVKFTIDWIGGMHYRLFFTINGSTGKKLYDNSTAPVITATAGLLALSGLILFLRYGKRILQGDPMLVFMLFVVMVYYAAVWGRNFNDYLHLGQMVAINGRYLQPLLLPVILVLIASFQWAFRLMPEVKLIIVVTALLLFLSGGGISGYLHYSDVNWYFEGHSWIIQLNEFGKKLVAPVFFWRT